MPLPAGHYDYIIAGGGCAGLTLLTRMLTEEKLRDKKILLIDKEEKNLNDRTWCFWEKEPGFFESTVHKSWQALDFLSSVSRRRVDIHPYKYKMIRSSDFYNLCNRRISSSQQVQRLRQSVDGFSNEREGVHVLAGGKQYTARYLFNSTLNGIDFQQPPHIFLRQHFRGWLIETAHDIFDPSVATLMDFRVPQDRGTAFFYTLPISSRRALVEYTLFTKEVLMSDEYTTSLKNYISEFITKDRYRVEEEENGVIPMTNYPFKVRDGRVINIGTAGGHTKASTGYTFQFIQKGTARIVASLVEQDNVSDQSLLSKARFARYDSMLLRVLAANGHKGAELFRDIFQKGSIQSVLRFLDNESTPGEELAIMSRMPKRLFLKAAFRELIGP